MRAVYAGVLLVLIAGCFWLLLLLCFIIGPKTGISFYPQYAVPLSLLAPLFFSGTATRYLLRQSPAALDRTEVMTLAAVIVAGFGLIAFLVEAAILQTALSQAEPISFAEVISQPYSERYSLRVLLGLSYFESALVAGAYVSLLKIPASVRLRIQLAKADKVAADEQRTAAD